MLTHSIVAFPFRRTLTAIALAMILQMVPTIAEAQQLPSLFLDPTKAESGRERVGVITGSRQGTYAAMGEQLERILRGEAARPFRVTVTLGRGSLRNLRDLIHLPGIDLAFVQSDVMEAYRGRPEIYKELRSRIRIVATLHQEPIHVLARGRQLDRLEKLDGLRVNIDEPGSGTNMTARTLFGRLGIKPIFHEDPPAAARARLLAGELDAMVFVTGRSNSLLGDIKFVEADRAGLHFLPIPSGGEGAEVYAPIQLTSADYKELIPADSPVTTRATTAVLAIVAWKPSDSRYAAAARFIELFFARASDLVQSNAGFSKEWCEADIGGSVPGWERFDVADRWLAQNPNATRKLAQMPRAGCR